MNRLGCLLCTCLACSASDSASPAPPATAAPACARDDDAALAADMTDAATRFLAALSPDQAARARFALDDPERFDWHFIPRTRRGIALGELAGAQRHVAYGFLATTLGRRGLVKATAIMALEEILHRREHGRGAFVRDPGAYHLTIFGEPSTTRTWGWRLEGHHLSLNVTLVDGVRPIAAPAFLGAAPSTSRVLGREEELGFRLLASLDAGRRRIAISSPTAPEDILALPGAALGELPGLAVGRMTPAQRRALVALLDELLATLPRELGDRERAAIAAHDLDAITFTWAGATTPDAPHYFRLSGPTFLYEYDNTQEQATHVHTVWHARGPAGGDFGVDLLREHYHRDHTHGAHR